MKAKQKADAKGGGLERESVLRQDIIRGESEGEGSQKTTPDVALAGDVVLIT